MSVAFCDHKFVGGQRCARCAKTEERVKAEAYDEAVHLLAEQAKELTEAERRLREDKHAPNTLEWRQIVDALRTELATERASKNQAYTERNRIVALLARLFPSGTRKTDIPGWDPEWHGCVFIDTAEGQLSWHYHDSDAHLFASLPPYEKPWDGHSTPEKYERLWRLTVAVEEP